MWFKKANVKMGIRQKLVLVILVIVCTSCGITTTYSVFKAISALKNNTGDALVELAKQGAKNILAVIDKQLLIISTAAENEHIRSMDWTQQEMEMEKLIKQHAFQSMAVVDKNRMAKYPGGETADLTNRDYIEKAFTGQTCMSSVIISRVTNSAVIMMASPVKDSSGAISAVLIARLSAGVLSDITDDIRYGEKGYSYIIDEKGTLIAHDNRDFIMNQRNFIIEGDTNPTFARLGKMMKKMVKMETGFDEYFFLGSYRFFGYTPIGKTGWSIAAGAIKNDVLASIPETLRAILFLSGVILIGAVIIAWFVAGSIVKPLKITLERFKDIAEGEGDLRKRLEINSGDETGEVARWFNQFAARIQDLIKSIIAHSNQLSTASNELSENSAQILNNTNEVSDKAAVVASATEQTLMNVTSISSGATEMSTMIATIAAAVEEMNASLNEVARSCQMESSITANADLQAKNTQEQMEKLGNSANQIGQVVKIIKAIADKTNLLSLNATIEAANAGDAGKGFAVVAKEVKELARQTSEATFSIGKQIGELQQVASTSVDNIKQITAIIDEINNISRSIVSAVEQQSVTVQEISKNLNATSSTASEIAKNVSDSAHGLEEVASKIKDVDRATKDNSKEVGMVSKNTQDLAKLAIVLEGLVNRFKV